MEPDGATWSRKGVKMDPNRATWNQKRCQNGSKGAAYNSPGAAYNDRSRLSGRKTHFLTLSATFLPPFWELWGPKCTLTGQKLGQWLPKELQTIPKGLRKEQIDQITRQASIPQNMYILLPSKLQYHCVVLCVCWVSDIVSGEDVMMNRQRRK